MAMTPLTGDPSALAARASRLTSTAATILKAAEDLERLSSNLRYKSEAISAIKDDADDVATVVRDVHTRYIGTAEALTGYAPKLDAAKERARKAILAANSTDVASARQARDSYFLHMMDITHSQADRDEYKRKWERAKIRLDEQKRALSNAQGEYDAAVEDKRLAAAAASGAIDTAMAKSKLNDSFLDKLAAALGRLAGILRAYYSAYLKLLKEILDVLGPILGIISLIIGFLAIFFPILAPIAGALFAISKLITLIQLLISVIQFAMGDLTFGQFLASMVFVVLDKLIGKLGLASKAATAVMLKLSTHHISILTLQVAGYGVSKGIGFLISQSKSAFKSWSKPHLEDFISSAVQPKADEIWHKAESGVIGILDNLKIPPIEIPHLEVPSIEIPQIEFPQFSMPDIRFNPGETIVNGLQDSIQRSFESRAAESAAAQAASPNTAASQILAGARGASGGGGW